MSGKGWGVLTNHLTFKPHDFDIKFLALQQIAFVEGKVPPLTDEIDNVSFVIMFNGTYCARELKEYSLKLVQLFRV